MADILIRGIEFPQSCGDCPFQASRWTGDFCSAGQFMVGKDFDYRQKHPNCPLVPLPEGHGDLIDRDNALLDIDCIGTNKFGMLDEDIRAFLRRYEPIVPAEGGGEDG